MEMDRHFRVHDHVTGLVQFQLSHPRLQTQVAVFIHNLCNRDNLRHGLRLLDDTFKRYHLTINVTKTKTMILNFDQQTVDYPSSISSLDDVSVDNVEVFRYLGCHIRFDEANTGNAEINLRIDSAESKFYELGKKFLNFNINLSTRVSLLNCLVRSRLTYACQTWVLTIRQKDRINSVYYSMLRKMVRGGYRRKEDQWSYVMTNKHLIELCKTEPVDTYAFHQQRRYLAHIIRREDSSISKKILFNCDRNSRPGRIVTLKTTVIEREQCTESTFLKRAMEKIY